MQLPKNLLIRRNKDLTYDIINTGDLFFDELDATVMANNVPAEIIGALLQRLLVDPFILPGYNHAEGQ